MEDSSSKKSKMLVPPEGQRLRIADLEAIGAIVQTKVKELKLVDRAKGPAQSLSAEQEHKVVHRVVGDLIQILLGYIEPEEAAPLFKSIYGGGSLDHLLGGNQTV